MNLHIGDGLDGTIYFPMGTILLNIGEIKYHIVGHKFEPHKYVDFKNTDKVVYSLASDKKIHKLRPKLEKEFNIKLHPDLLHSIIYMIFKHNPEVQK